jgi:hypothetical protein
MLNIDDIIILTKTVKEKLDSGFRFDTNYPR